MPAHHYRITVDALDPLAGDEGLESLSFFASAHSDLFAAARAVHNCIGCSAANASKLALALSLLHQVMHERHTETLLVPLEEPMHKLLCLLSPAPTTAVA